MRDLTPAFLRLTVIEAERRKLDAREGRELARLRRIGRTEVDRALRPLRLQMGVTILDAVTVDGWRWRVGIYLGYRIAWPPRELGDSWSVSILTQSVLASGRPGKVRGSRWFHGSTPRDAVACLMVSGQAVVPKPRG